MSAEIAYQTERLDHLGIVAGVCQEAGIAQWLDKQAGDTRRSVSIGKATVAMVLNGLGFSNRQLYLVPQYFENKPVEHLLGEGITADMLNDDCLGRTLDWLYEHDVTTLFAGLALQARRRFGIAQATFVFDGGMSSQINLDAMSQAQLKYVTRLSAARLQSLLRELSQEQQLELGDRSKVLEIVHEGQRYVIAGGPWRRQRDQERRTSRMAKGEAELKRLAAVKRKKVDVQKLASQVGRALQRLKAHKYFDYQVDPQGQLKWNRKKQVIQEEEQRDGWYLLHTNQTAQECTVQGVLGHYKGLLEVEEAFCELKSYLEVRPVFHWRVDRVINHVRLCFLAYWLSARLGREWRARGESEEVPRILRKLQTIRLGKLRVGQAVHQNLMTEIPKDLNEQLCKLGLTHLFAASAAAKTM